MTTPQPEDAEDFRERFLSTPDYSIPFSKIVAQIWSDSNFENEFNTDPATVMRANGIPLPAGLYLRREDVVIPPRPAEVTDEVLRGSGINAAASGTAGTASSFSCPGCTAGTFGSYGGAIQRETTAE